MHLSTAAWPEIEAYLSRSRGILIPIGSHEQHGPTGLTGTDALCPEIIARAAMPQADILVAPTFSVGMAQHHLGFPGTITLRPSTMIAAIVDWVESLTRHGFTRIYFLNGHGGNVATINAAFSEVYAAYSFAGELCPVRLMLRNWWELPGVEKLCLSLFPVGHGSHATASEVAVTYWAYPETEALKNTTLTPKIAPTGVIRDAADYRAQFPDGRIGSDPLQASAEKGGEIVAAAAAALCKEVTNFFAG